MPVPCTVCGSSFKDPSALHMHKVAKSHGLSTATANDISGLKNPLLQPLNWKPSSTGPLKTVNVTSSAGFKFRCDTCNRSFKSHESLEAHAEAKSHATTVNTKVERLEVKKRFSCDVCGRRDLGSQVALDAHKRGCRGHQTGKQKDVPPARLPKSATKTNHEPSLQSSHTTTLMVDKMVQCDLCRCDTLGNMARNIEMVRPPCKGRKEPQVFLSNVIESQSLASLCPTSSGNVAFYVPWESTTDINESAADTIDEQLVLAGKGDMVGGPRVESSIWFSQASVVEGLLGQTPPWPQLSSNLVDVYGPAQANTLQHLGKDWSMLPTFQQPFILRLLGDLCHSVSDLESNGYHLREYTLMELAGEQKCKACKRRQRDILQHKLPCKVKPKKERRSIQKNSLQPQESNVTTQATQPNCSFLPTHTFHNPDPRKQTRDLDSAWTPPSNLNQPPKRCAVALDCEMVDVAGNGGTFWREVVRLSAVDFLTGEILLNTLVLPTAKVIRWKSDITGITAETITEAKQRRGHGLLKGWKAARAELWRFINADTVLIGQSLHHDLEVLGMLHRRVVDSAILAAAAASGGGGPTVTGARPRTFGLKLMCRELLGVDVQCCGDGQVHDCLEDVLATRELVLWMLCNPRELRMWAVEKNGEGVAPRPGKIKGKRKGKENAVGADIWGYRGGGGRLGGDNYDEEEEEEEILQWADIAEDIGWPHPNTGYDPWSD